MKHLMTLLALVVAVTAGAQIIDTTLAGNAMHMNLNLTKLDSTISALQEIVEAQQATIESLQTGSFDGDYNSLSNLPTLFDGDYSSLSNQPTIPSNVSDLTNDAGYTTFDGAYGSLSGAPNLAAVATSGSYSDLSNKVTQIDIFQSAYNLRQANFANANLEHVNLSGMDLFDVNFTNANLYGANFSNAIFYGAVLTNANFTNANLSGADWYAVADVSGVTWTGATVNPFCTDTNNDGYCD